MTTTKKGPIKSIIPKGAAYDSRLAGLDLRVLIAVGATANGKTGRGWKEQKTFAAELGISQQAFSKSWLKLIGYGYIVTAREWIEEIRRTGNVFYIQWEAEAPEGKRCADDEPHHHKGRVLHQAKRTSASAEQEQLNSCESDQLASCEDAALIQLNKGTHTTRKPSAIQLNQDTHTTKSGRDTTSVVAGGESTSQISYVTTLKDNKRPHKTTERVTAVAQHSTYLPDDFSISDEMRGWANEEKPGIDIDLATKKFIRHCLAKGETSHNWRASWERWVLNERQSPSRSAAASRRDGGQDRSQMGAPGSFGEGGYDSWEKDDQGNYLPDPDNWDEWRDDHGVIQSRVVKGKYRSPNGYKSPLNAPFTGKVAL